MYWILLLLGLDVLTGNFDFVTIYSSCRKVSILPPGLQARKEIFESNLKNKKGIDVDMELLAKSSAGI